MREKTPSYRSLDEHPRWQEALHTLHKLTAAEREIEAAAGVGGGDYGSKNNFINRLSCAFLSWGRSTDESENIETPRAARDEGAAAEHLAACREAIAEHSRCMSRLQIELSSEVYKFWEAEHKAAREKIAVAIVGLADAILMEAKLAAEMSAAGALTGYGVAFRPWVSGRACPLIRRAFQGFSISDFMRDNQELFS